MNWYYAKGRERVGPVPEPEWERLVRENEIGPQTLVWHDGLEQWTPYGELSGPAEPVDEEPPLADVAHAGQPTSLDHFASQLRESDYRLSLRACTRSAFRLIGRAYWPIAGAALLVLLVEALFSLHPFSSAIVTVVLSEVFLGGLYAFILHIMRTGEKEIALLFSGFARGCLVHLISRSLWEKGVILLNLLVAKMVLNASGVFEAGFTPEAMTPEQALMLLFVGGIILIPSFYYVVCWTFATPLIIDYRMPFGQAMRLSREKVLQHPWRVSFGISLGMVMALLPLVVLVPLAGLLNLPGGKEGVAPFFLALGLSVPFFFAMFAVMYEIIFTPPARPPQAGE